jgi:hypothetical protein
VRGALAAKPIDVGPEAARAGVRVVVDATILHLFSNGTDGRPVVGECPKMPPLVDRPPPPFGAMGGAAYGEDPNGTCVLQDAGDFKHKHIEVRTKTSVVLPGAPPPLASSLPKPRPKPFNLWRLLFDDHSRHGDVR